jgi:hypothetical protein
MNRLRRGVLPYVRRRSSFIVVVVVFSAIQMSVGKEKSDEEAKKEQRKGVRKKEILEGKVGV